MIKPCLFVAIIFWGFYLSGLAYYSGRDKQRRYAMTKKQNRQDLAEIKDDEIQQTDTVMREMLIRGFMVNKKQQIDKREELEKITEAMRHDKYSEAFIERATKQIKQKNLKKIQDKLPKDMEDLSKKQLKTLKKRARGKVFGRVGSLLERASETFKRNGKTPDDMMEFFWLEFKSAYLFGLLSKTSKIAPRHARLTVMYLGVSV